jgi:hypothetical protein
LGARHFLEFLIRHGQFYVENNKIVQEFGEDPEVQGLLDAALHHKGMKVVRARFTL